jgi:hypothetical protein
MAQAAAKPRLLFGRSDIDPPLEQLSLPETFDAIFRFFLKKGC